MYLNDSVRVTMSMFTVVMTSTWMSKGKERLGEPMKAEYY